MRLIADLHVHSRFSRATSKSLDFVSLHRAALEKGIGLLGTGDFTHPGWMAEIEEQLEPAEDGLFQLRPELARAAEAGLPAACAGRVRFVLQVEISNIYKKAERVRKNHNLVYVPTLDAAKRFTEKLAAIGNVASDGRPILGLDARDLLEITLETDPLAFLIPAHIWTPWFSMLGSKSGFDSIEECFEDLSDHVFAGETGLSSDPPMNWRLSSLDRITLVSNSDAHSAAKLGREANLLEIELGFEPLLAALRDRAGYLGTIEFYPEEGKYHLDGHRKCQVRLEPEQTRELDGRCPECGGKLTVGVMSRVLDLADRPVDARPTNAGSFSSLVPLAEATGEILGVGPSTKKAQALLQRLLNGIGPELTVLMDAPLDDIERAGGPATSEAISRIRTGRLSIAAGYDGEFGTVRIFEPAERDHLLGQMALPGAPKPKPKRTGQSRRSSPSREAQRRSEDGLGRRPTGESALRLTHPDDPLAGLDPQQRRAAETTRGPLLIVAGPGSGKTHTLVARIAHQLRTGAVMPREALAVSFTNQAADELRERIAESVPSATGDSPLVTTFHGFGMRLLTEVHGEAPRVVDEEERLEITRRCVPQRTKERDVANLLSRISLAKQSPDPLTQIAGDDQLASAFDVYESELAKRAAIDVDDLVLSAYLALAGDASFAAVVRERFHSVSIDEYQDVNDVQAAVLALLWPSGEELCAIGDPNQAIYGFRGAKPGHFARFAEAFPGGERVALETSYRLSRQVLAVARSVVDDPGTLVARTDGPKIELVDCPTAASEAEQILVRLERIIGGTSHFAVDSGRGDDAEESDVGFGDVAVLVRTKAQRKEILEALGRSSIPCRAVGEDEPHDPRSEKLAVMSMHAAKGREFEVVFVAGVEAGLMPLEGRDADPTEERRLLYVALTRAKRLLVISHAGKRSLWGKRLPGGPS
ncbi:MAG: UvrD-helicase domain-containing protein, partial [Deltaproteobacteria bacterium]|nr:UvrD-helicase domain-containing protein [Deltaproteobacteria bacterium]